MALDFGTGYDPTQMTPEDELALALTGARAGQMRLPGMVNDATPGAGGLGSPVRGTPPFLPAGTNVTPAAAGPRIAGAIPGSRGVPYGMTTPAAMNSNIAKALPQPAAAAPEEVASNEDIVKGVGGMAPRISYPDVPTLDPRYQDAVSRRATAERGVNPNDPNFKPSMGRRIAGGIAGGMMAFGHRPDAYEAGHAAIYQKRDEEAARLARESTAAGTEAQGYEQEYGNALGKYNAQMKQIEDTINNRRVDVAEDRADAYMRHQQVMEDRYGRIADMQEQGKDETERHNRAMEELAGRKEGRMEKSGKGGALSRKQQDELQAADAKRQGRLAEIEDEIASKTDSKGNHISGDPNTYRQREQRKAENDYAVEVNKNGVKYKAAEYPNWKTGASTTQTTSAGAPTSQVGNTGAAPKAAPQAAAAPAAAPQAKAAPAGKELDRATALQYYTKAGGDMEKAKSMAKQAGYTRLAPDMQDLASKNGQQY